MNSITLCLNMTKTNSKEVRVAMAEAGIVPEHLQLKWLHLNIHPLHIQGRWSTVATTSYHTNQPSLIVEPDQFIAVFSFLLLQPTLHAHQYMESIKLKPKQVRDLSIYGDWQAWVKNHYGEA